MSLLTNKKILFHFIIPHITSSISLFHEKKKTHYMYIHPIKKFLSFHSPIKKFVSLHSPIKKCVSYSIHHLKKLYCSIHQSQDLFHNLLHIINQALFRLLTLVQSSTVIDNALISPNDCCILFFISSLS